MCGRINQKTEGHEVAKAMQVVQLRMNGATLRPRYNIAPSQQVPVVTLEPNDTGTMVRTLRDMRWGFVPIWAESATKGTRPINATAEKVATSGMFRNSFRKWRCLVPATGFYEWHQNEDGTKTPFHITLPTGELFAFAGILSLWRPKPAAQEPIAVHDEQCVYTFAILTTTPTPLVAQIHDRMPVIVSPDQWDVWLDHFNLNLMSISRGPL